MACGRTPSKRVLYRSRAASYAASVGRTSVPRSCPASALQSGGPAGVGDAVRSGVVELGGAVVGLADGRTAGAAHPTIVAPADARNARRVRIAAIVS